MKANESLTTVPADVVEMYMNGIVAIATAYLANNNLDPDRLPELLRGIGAELTHAIVGGQAAVPDRLPVSLPDAGVGSGIRAGSSDEAGDRTTDPEGSPESVSDDGRFAHLPRVPAVPIGESVTDEAIICLFDGEPKLMLKRYIRSKYGMEAADYRAFWNLPEDYPLVAPGYAREKKIVALAQGLGTSRIPKTPRISAAAAA